MAKKKTRKLLDIEAEEISLVESPANQRRFLIVKSDEGADPVLVEIGKSLRKIFPGKAGKDLEQIELRDLDDEALKEIKGALEVLSKYSEDMPDDILAALKTLIKFSAGEPEGYGEKEGEDDEGEDENDEGKPRRRTKKSGDWDSMAAAIFRSRPDLLLKLMKKAAEEEEESLGSSMTLALAGKKPVKKGLSEADDLDEGSGEPKTDSELWPSICGRRE